MQIKSSLTRIEKALDLRFEKDSSLYISKEDTEKLKEYLYKKHVQNIDAMSIKLGNKVVANIVLKNSYLVDIGDFKLKGSLDKLFKSLDKDFFINISRDIVEDKMFSTIEFKEFIEKLFFKEVSLSECAKNYHDINEKIDNRAICLERYLLEDYALKNSSSNLVRFIDAELKKYPDIANYFSNRNQNFLSKIFSVTQNKAEIAKWIIENKILTSDMYWLNGLNSLGEDGFNQMIAYVKTNPSYENEITKKICSKQFRSFYKLENFIESISNLFSAHKEIRFHLTNMLEPGRFKDKDIALKITANFRTSAGNYEKLLDKLSKIESWENKEAVEITPQSLLEEINNTKRDISKIQTLDYFKKVFYDKPDHANYLYYNQQNNTRVIDVLSFYFADLLRKKGSFSQITALNLTPIYVEKIGDWIEKLDLDRGDSEQFLETHKRHDVLEKLFHKR